MNYVNIMKKLSPIFFSVKSSLLIKILASILRIFNQMIFFKEVELQAKAVLSVKNYEFERKEEEKSEEIYRKKPLRPLSTDHLGTD